MADLISLGFGGGQIIGQQADDAARMSALSQLKLQGDIAQQPAEGDLKRAHAKLYAAQAAKAEEETRQEAAIAQAFKERYGSATAAMAGVAEGKVSMEAMPLALAQIAADAGAPTKAMKYLEDASQMAQRGASARNAEANERQHQLTTKIKEMELGGQLLNGVKDEATAAEAERAFKAMTGKSLFAGRPYSAELVDFMKAGSLSVKEKADLELRREIEDRRVETDKQQESLRETQRVLNQARTNATNARADALRKAGGKPATAPNGKEIEAARTYLGGEFAGAETEGMGEAAIQVAAQAKALLKQNQAIPDYDAALRSVIAQAKQNGDFQEFNKTFAGVDVSGVPGVKKIVRFQGRGKTPYSAIPADKDTVRVVGRYYSPKSGPFVGQVLQWDGKKFKPAVIERESPGVSPPPARASLETELEE